jgi:alginate O-acetyltransferase complex protein AlgI
MALGGTAIRYNGLPPTMSPLLFTDPAFLFLFLPTALACYYLTPRHYRNSFLFGASLLLYAWGEQIYGSILLVSIAINYCGGLAIGRSLRHRRLFLIAGVLLNLFLLITFKYVPFLVQNYDSIATRLNMRPSALPLIHLPVGISFYTFMGISYLVDIYREEVQAESSPLRFGLYLSLFPHLIAGPIVRYCDIAAQLGERRTGLHDFAAGVRRFIVGLGKKMLVGNTVALVTDSIMQLPRAQLTTRVAWLGIACYALQIYYDFSGYSDMAIGLARMFGFSFPENFNYPYISRSITEFWKRWHITLATWLRDYLFFPLGVRGPRYRLYRNVLIVFGVCGLWHGASWHFVIWGLFQGVLLVVERMGLLKLLDRLPRVVGHAYALCAIVTGWALFRAEDLPHALVYIGAMFGVSAGVTPINSTTYVTAQLSIVTALGTLGCMPILPALNRWLEECSGRLEARSALALEAVAGTLRIGVYATIMLGSSILIAAGTYNPFIYFRF